MSHTPDPVTAGPERISFEVDGVELTDAGQLVITGRWFGIRGRRFVRPTLTMTLPDGSERRALADLDHKPWAAEDGEPWLAAFAVDVKPEHTSSTELSVAPDIIVALDRPGATAVVPRRRRRPRILPPAQETPYALAPASTSESGAAPAPETGRTRAADAGTAAEAPRPSPPAGSRELARLRERVAAAERSLEGERARRDAADQALEAERAENLRLRSELGRVQAELDLGRAAQAEAAAAAADLESARQEILAAGRRHERLTREHDRSIDAHAEVQTALHERAGALESAREAIAEQRAELENQRLALAAERAQKDRLRAQLARAQASTKAPATESPEGATAGGEVPRDTAPATSRQAPAPSPPVDRPAASARVAPPTPRSERPLNPSLRHTNWLGRALALLVILAVIAAVVLVIHSTV